MAQNFLPEHRISIAVAASARAEGQTAINGAMVDMQGYEGVVAVVEMGTIAATAVLLREQTGKPYVRMEAMQTPRLPT